MIEDTFSFEQAINILLLFETLALWKENTLSKIKLPDFGFENQLKCLSAGNTRFLYFKIIKLLNYYV